ncbi:hypothetical protein CYLTODRAFT_491331 [Cylindrobasidium torrendii FP15055 ss-10]|uniref:Uncharacterized protein n=1 Tax=Cylindrobasidium torrendii FP15055 ss-10 TaxID=1314674 RepID=A0A0D7B7S9_9AGAR|nr:hypothetical protein CYLTODRAFT_491331 [Cylindrobasidium torrendii FP15055 ss-10]
MKCVSSRGSKEVTLQTSSTELLSLICHQIPSYRKYGWPVLPKIEETMLRYADALLESMSINLAFELVPTRITHNALSLAERVSLIVPSHSVEEALARWAEAECTLRMDILRGLMDSHLFAASNEMIRASKALSESQERLAKLRASTADALGHPADIDVQSMPAERTDAARDHGGEGLDNTELGSQNTPIGYGSPASTLPSVSESAASNGVPPHIHPSRMELVQTAQESGSIPLAAEDAVCMGRPASPVVPVPREAFAIHPSRIERVYPSLSSQEADEVSVGTKMTRKSTKGVLFPERAAGFHSRAYLKERKIKRGPRISIAHEVETGWPGIVSSSRQTSWPEVSTDVQHELCMSFKEAAMEPQPTSQTLDDAEYGGPGPVVGEKRRPLPTQEASYKKPRRIPDFSLWDQPYILRGREGVTSTLLQDISSGTPSSILAVYVLWESTTTYNLPLLDYLPLLAAEVGEIKVVRLPKHAKALVRKVPPGYVWDSLEDSVFAILDTDEVPECLRRALDLIPKLQG